VSVPAGALLRRAEGLRDLHGPDAAREKLALLRAAGRRRLASADEVRRLHEVLCFWRAYPDGRPMLSAVERELKRFARRADLRRFRAALENSGIAGTDIVYSFGLWTASWLAARWPERLSIEWPALGEQTALTRTLLLLVLPAEAPGLDEAPLPLRAWVERLAGPRGSAASFFIDRSNRLPAPAPLPDRVFDAADVPFRLTAGPGTPSRTLARFAPSPVVFQRGPIDRQRPDLAASARRPPDSIRSVSREDALRLVDLAHEAMVTRERDLDAFAWADPRDVRLVECGGGLQFACIGVVPERRFLLESVYGFLTLKNGVPIGYALGSGLCRSSEIAYNVFASFRGGEAAHVYGRFLATVRALFACDTFEVPPYQLGDGNDEGLESGAWWFYYKLGLRPRARAIEGVVRREAARIEHDSRYRTPPATLRRLVRHHLFFSLGRRREDVIGMVPFDRVGLAVTDYLSSRFGDDRERAARTVADEAGHTLGVGDWSRLPAGQRVWWERWAPLVAILPGVRAWPLADRRALVEVIRAKGGRRESDFVPLFDRHSRLRAAVLALACRGGNPRRWGRQSGCRST